ncbi:MAG: hypothetical protein IPP90_18375 [Gemmatimonadaceae bacterium]|nr:hypothetical protein [Gemmatimonadaceae bacterium]
MSNAAKHRKKAAEFEQLKQFDRAIASYIQAIEESESAGEDVDVVLLNKVGDLTLRQGRVADAVTYYERAVEHYAASGLFNNAIALCNKILRSAPGRSNVYFTLGRICAKKGLRGDATRNFLEYATRMQQEGRVDEGMRALAEVADLMPELTEIRGLVEEHALRVGIALPRRKTPVSVPVTENERAVFRRDDKSKDLVFLDVGLSAHTTRNTPPLAPRIQTPIRSLTPSGLRGSAGHRKTDDKRPGVSRGYSSQVGPASLDAYLLFDPTRPGSVTPIDGLMAVPPASAPAVEPTADVARSQAPDPVNGVEAEALVGPVSEVHELVAETAKLVHEPAVEPFDEPVAEAIDEPVAEDIDEPVAEAIDEPVAGAIDELVEPVLHALDVPIVADEPDTVPVDESAMALADEPVTAMVEEPVSVIADEPPVGGVFDLEESGLDIESPLDTDVEALVPATLEPIEGLDMFGDFVGDTIAAMDGLTSELSDTDMPPIGDAAEPALTWLMPPDAIDPMDASNGLELIAEIGDTSGLHIDAISDLVIEDFDHVADDPHAIAVTGGRAGTPAYSLSVPRSLTPIEVSPIPELEAAIEAGAMTASLAESDASLVPSRPPFRLDPHDFILPGELPPLVVDDSFVTAGMHLDAAGNGPLGDEAMASAFDEEAFRGDEAPLVLPLGEPGQSDPAEAESDLALTAEAPTSETAAVTSVDMPDEVDEPGASSDSEFEDALRATIEAHRAISTTPSLPIAAVAAEANVVASSRRDDLRASVARTPQDWVLRRRLAEALFEAGEREGGLSELQAALSGFAQSGNLPAAVEIADELVGISPERIQYHQKRVELAVRLSDQQRLRVAYLDLADTLVRAGDDIRAHAVYARVLEIDPWDERARSALGSAAPPPPPRPHADDEFVNLAEWLREDEPGTTRMRMREPIVSGDEQADFDALLRHFKEGCRALWARRTMKATTIWGWRIRRWDCWMTPSRSSKKRFEVGGTDFRRTRLWGNVSWSSRDTRSRRPS